MIDNTFCFESRKSMMAITRGWFAALLLFSAICLPAQDNADAGMGAAGGCAAPDHERDNAATPQQADKDAVWLALDNGDVDQAQAGFVQWSEPEQQIVAGRIIAARMLAASDRKAAAKQLQALAAAHPDNADIPSQLGVISINRAQQANMFSALGHAKDAVKYWQQALEIDPEHPRALRALAMYYLGAPGIAGGDKAKAAEFADRLLKLDAPAALGLQAQILVARDEQEAAVQALDEALLQYPQAANLYSMRARWQAEAEQWDAAWEDLQRACQHAEDAYLRRSVQYQSGRLAVLSGQYAAAGIAALRLVHNAGDERYQGWTQLRLAQLYLRRSELEQAREMLELVDADSDNKQLRKQRRALAEDLQQMPLQQADQVRDTRLPTAD